MQDNMASKKDLEGLATKHDLERFVSRNEFDDKLNQVKSDLMTHMDGFIGLHQKLDLELVALRAKYDRLESYITQLAKHANVTLQ